MIWIQIISLCAVPTQKSSHKKFEKKKTRHIWIVYIHLYICRMNVIIMVMNVVRFVYRH